MLWQKSVRARECSSSNLVVVVGQAVAQASVTVVSVDVRMRVGGLKQPGQALRKEEVQIEAMANSLSQPGSLGKGNCCASEASAKVS